MFKRILIALVFLAAGLVVYAGSDEQDNPNDPDINEQANACFEGGTMDGKCDSEWAWTCGWYMIRFEQGIFAREQVPTACESLLPAPFVPVDEPRASGPAPYVPPTAGCVFFIGLPLSGTDGYINFNGGNFLPATTPYSFDPIGCTTPNFAIGYNTAYAPNGIGDANTICQANGFGSASVLPNGYNTDLYQCN